MSNALRGVCRPLAKELIEYARTDVHFLLYIANVLRAKLAARGQSVLQDACRRSHAMALTLYTKPTAQVNTYLCFKCTNVLAC